METSLHGISDDQTSNRILHSSWRDLWQSVQRGVRLGLVAPGLVCGLGGALRVVVSVTGPDRAADRLRDGRLGSMTSSCGCRFNEVSFHGQSRRAPLKRDCLAHAPTL